MSAAQIAKRTSIDRPTENAALAVTKADQTRNRLESGDLTLEEAAIFAEFEHDPDAAERLERARTTRWGDSVEHVAQKLRDEAAERAAYAAEVERLRAEGLPVLSAQEADEADGSLVLEDMRTAEGEPVPVEEWPNLSGVALIVTEDWEYPEPEATEGEDDADDEDAYEYAEPVKVYRLLWVVTDIEASGLVHRSRVGRTDDDQGDDAEAHDPGTDAADEAEAEARRQERRRVIANNKAWASVLLTAPPEDPSRGPRRRWMQWTRYDRRYSTGAGSFRGSGQFVPVRRHRCPSLSSTGPARRSSRCRRSCGT